jgi:hypothetical protein
MAAGALRPGWHAGCSIDLGAGVEPSLRPKSAVFNAKDGWPHIDTTTDTTAQHARKAMAQTAYAAIESATYQGATILNGLTSMLGPPGVTAADAALSQIAGTGQTPMMVVLAVRTEQQITMLVTTAGLAARVVH